MAAWRARHALIVGFCCLVAAAPGVAAQLVNVNPTGDASGGGVVVSPTGDATAGCVSLVVACAPGASVSGTGISTGGSAVSGTGTSEGAFLAVSGLGSAESNGISVTTQGASTGGLLVLSIVGDASCNTSQCYAVSITGQATNGTAVSGCDLLSAADLRAMCGQGSYETAYWAVYDLLT